MIVAVSLYILLLIIVAMLTILLVLPRRRWWTLWLAVIAVSAIGPLLDIVTGLPMNWLLGLGILGLAGTLSFRHLLPPRTGITAVPHQLNWPVLGTGFSIYVVYLFLQTIRLDVEFLTAVLALRSPLTGLSAYFLTAYCLRARTDGILLARVHQFVRLFMYVGVFVAAYGIFQFVVGFEHLQAWGLTESNGLYIHNQRNLNGASSVFRIFSTMRRNEALGAFLYLNIVISVVAFHFRVKPFKLILINLSLSVISLLLSLSLTSIVTPAIWLGFVVLTNRSKRILHTVALIGIAVLLITFFVNWQLDGLIWIRFQEHWLDAQQGIGRLAMLRNWFVEMNDRSFFEGMLGSGICTGADQDVLARVGGIVRGFGIQTASAIECDWTYQVYDNWYATHSLEIGWLGVVLIWLVFSSIVVSILPRIRRYWRMPERNGWTILALGLLALWPSGFVGALIVYMPITIYFWSMAAILDAGANGKYRI